jgi:hypothetical protein
VAQRRSPWLWFGIPLVALCAASGLLLAVMVGHHGEGNLSILAASVPTLSLVSAPAESIPLTGGFGGLAATGSRHSTNNWPSEPALVEPAWVAPAGGARNNAVPALLSFPAGWRTGDPAAAVLVDRSWAEDWRSDLVAEPLAAGAAVLDLDIHAARRVSPESAAAPSPPLAEDLLPDLFGALRLLRDEVEAGPIVALGRGAGGAAALLAGREPIAARYLGANGPRFAANAQLDGGCERSTAAGEALVGWRAVTLHYGTVLAATDVDSPPWARARALESASLACASALVPPLPGQRSHAP